MNDFEAMEAISQLLDQWFWGRLTDKEALNQIAQISGANKISHEEAKGQHQ